MKEFWNERFGQEEYVYGVEPNGYFREKIDEITTKAKILFPAEGEGRNAVYAASLGWDVTAFDQSVSGKDKALRLAKQNKVELDYQIVSAEEVNFPVNSFDALVLIYAHFPKVYRKKWHEKFTSYLKPGGLLILEGFSKTHVANQKENPKAGGPRAIEMLFDLEILKEDFPDFEFVEALQTQTDLEEGEGHKGLADVVRIFAKKK